MPSDEKRCSICSASTSAACVAGTSISTAAQATAIAITPRITAGPIKCCARPASGAFVHSDCSVTGMSSDTRSVASDPTIKINRTLTRAVRLRACTRGGGSSWAARGSTSTLPTIGSVNAKPTRYASTLSADDQPVNGAAGTVSTSRNGSIPALIAVPSAHSTVISRIATAIQIAEAIRSRARPRPMRIRSHRLPMTVSATGVARSSGRTKPVNRQPPIAVASTPAT